MTLLELLAVVSVLGIVATLVLARSTSLLSSGNKQSCYLHKHNVELQSTLWHRYNGTWPSSSLLTVGADSDFFPEGLPVCPVDGTSYTIDASGKVIGHTH